MRLTTLDQDTRSITLKLEGWIGSSDARLLESECSTHLHEALDVRLECSGLAYLGGDAVAALRRLMARGLQLIDCPPIILEIIGARAS
jgi:hypothetical protein